MSTQKLNMDSRIPLYYQLIQHFRQQIEEEEFKPGDPFPTENELCEMYGVSRPTVRQALNELVREGLLYRLKGKGTFVSEPKIQQDFIQKLMSFTEEMEQKGLRGSTEVLDLSIIPASKFIAAQLELCLGDSVWHLKRRRSINGEPIVIVVTYLPAKLFPGLDSHDLNNRSLYTTLETEYGVRVKRARRTLEVLVATGENAELLNVEEGAPLQLSRTIAWDQRGVPVELSVARYRGDRSQFTIDLYR